MKRAAIYEYDRKNRELIADTISEDKGQIISWARFAKDDGKISFPLGTKRIFIDATSLFVSEDRAVMSIAYIETILSIIFQVQKYEMYLICERQYAATIKNLVYYRISEIKSLEEFLDLNTHNQRNIVDLSEEEFDNVFDYFDENLVGNPEFKKKLKTELEKYRLFNFAGQQRIFSCLLCGSTGIGKTETARLFHRALAPGEPMIKLNFGNYSSDNALNSLIGSPRGYVGSNKGELSDKLSNSRSSVILIDEFEKAKKLVYNFFLQLLEDGEFTDSLGRDYNLNKYMIFFTSNMDFSRVTELLSAELCSRFNFMYRMSNLTEDEKRQYVDTKIDSLVKKLESERNLNIPQDVVVRAKSIDVSKFQDMRKLNSAMMHHLSEIVYPVIYSSD